MSRWDLRTDRTLTKATTGTAYTLSAAAGSLAITPIQPNVKVTGAAGTTGAKAPTAATTAAEDPWLDDDWVTPQNIYGAGTASVTATSFDAGDQTYVLKAYTFDMSTVPANANINGVTVIVNAYYASALAPIDLMQAGCVPRKDRNEPCQHTYGANNQSRRLHVPRIV